ncbi:NACHT, LRR and PYD domains-containing protein 12-like [Astyanax mexicanus]|uniref:NACHT, LRR and PYD domains-containing protein 12-like n=1 Tax=Astyanax mexicanus TaxID=7994 RepID=A0A8T2MI11_ASTMX|nr:NACHT, LRR and PYD domains-containing protein 12-like [Astyanax mexicanus]
MDGTLGAAMTNKPSLTSYPSPVPTPPLSASEPMELGSRRLSPEELQRRFREGLCLYCGGSNHARRDCGLRPSGAHAQRLGQRREFTPGANVVSTSARGLVSKSFLLPVLIRCVNESFSVLALIDCGAEGNFISAEVVERLQIPTEPVNPSLRVTALDEDWPKFLVWAEMAQNSLRCATTGLTPFQVYLGYQPPLAPCFIKDRNRRLASCNLGEKTCESLGSVLKLENFSIKKIDLSNNDLQDSGVELLSAGLRSLHCKLQILRLSGCMITEKGCSSLSSALSSNPSHLKELDLTYNHPGESGELSARLKDPHCSLETLRMEHGGEIRIKPGLKKSPPVLGVHTRHPNFPSPYSPSTGVQTCVLVYWETVRVSVVRQRAGGGGAGDITGPALCNITIYISEN